MTHRERDDEIGQEHHEIRGGADQNGETRLDKEKVPENRRQTRGEKSRTAADEDPKHEHANQINEGYRLVADPALKNEIEACDPGDCRCSQAIRAQVEAPEAGNQWWRQGRILALRPDDVDIHVTALADKPVQERTTTKKIERAPAGRLADNELGCVLFPGNSQQSTHDIVIRRGDYLRAKFTGESQMFCEASLVFIGERARQLDIDGHPGRMKLTCQTPGPAQESGRGGAGTD